MSKSNRKTLSSNLPIEAIDAIIKSGKDPLELMKEMKKAIMERALNAELDHHLANDESLVTILVMAMVAKLLILIMALLKSLLPVIVTLVLIRNLSQNDKEA